MSKFLFSSVVAFGAMLLPVLVSIRVAQQQAIDGEFALLRVYARDALRRSEISGDQSIDGFRKLREARLLPCSAAEVDLMRQIALGAGYLQAIGRVRGEALVCSSLGSAPIQLGPPSYMTANGRLIRNHVHLPVRDNEIFGVIEENGFASILNPELTLDTITDSPEVALGAFSPSKHVFNLQRGQLDSTWLKMGDGPQSSFRDRGALIVLQRSQRYDLATIASFPVNGLKAQRRRALLLFIPFGLISGLSLAAALLYFTRIRSSMPAELRSAARCKDFFLEYQPVVDLHSGECVGAEALVRWRRSGEIIRPDLFIPAAEACGVIKLITKYVFEQAALDLPSLLQQDPTFHLGLNVSAADLRSPSTIEAVERLIKMSGIPPGQLIIEATERGFLEDPAIPMIIDGMRALGVKVSIDDFGTGYSSLSALEKLNVNALKIDKSFVESIGTDGATSNVVTHIIAMAHSLKLDIIAEGVETEDQAKFLRAHGVRLAQGWLFGKPVSLEALALRLVNSSHSSENNSPIINSAACGVCASESSGGRAGEHRG